MHGPVSNNAGIERRSTTSSRKWRIPGPAAAFVCRGAIPGDDGDREALARFHRPQLRLIRPQRTGPDNPGSGKAGDVAVQQSCQSRSGFAKAAHRYCHTSDRSLLIPFRYPFFYFVLSISPRIENVARLGWEPACLPTTTFCGVACDSKGAQLAGLRNTSETSSACRFVAVLANTRFR